MRLIKLLFLVASLLAAPIVWPQQPGAHRYLAARESLERLVVEAASRGQAPRVSESDVAQVFAVLGDTAILRERSFGVQDLNLLIDICGAANSANMKYVLFGMNSINRNHSPADVTNQLQQLMEANTVKYQDEIFVLTPFLIDCTATFLPVLSKFFEGLPQVQRTEIRMQGLQNTRRGAVIAFASALNNLVDERISLRNRSRLLASLANVAEHYAAVMPVEQRREIASLAASALQRAPEAFRPQLGRVQVALSELSCTGICRF